MNENFQAENFNTEIEQTVKRPTFLTVLCILTFIGSGFSAISNLSWAIFYDSFLEFMGQNPSNLFQQVYETILATSRWMFAFDFLLYLTSIVGAIFMLNLKKIGFHIYTVSNVLLVITPVFFTENQGINFFGLMFVTAPFILLYGLHLKYMK